MELSKHDKIAKNLAKGYRIKILSRKYENQKTRKYTQTNQVCKNIEKGFEDSRDRGVKWNKDNRL